MCFNCVVFLWYKNCLVCMEVPLTYLLIKLKWKQSEKLTSALFCKIPVLCLVWKNITILCQKHSLASNKSSNVLKPCCTFLITILVSCYYLTTIFTALYQPNWAENYCISVQIFTCCFCYMLEKSRRVYKYKHYLKHVYYLLPLLQLNLVKANFIKTNTSLNWSVSLVQNRVILVLT